MNVGAALLTVAVLMGLKVSLMVMYPLPLVGAQMGIWSMNAVVVGFTGIYLVLACMILFYPILVIKMLFFGKKRPELVLSERSLNDPGMLGMILSALTLLVTGTPLVIVGTTVWPRCTASSRCPWRPGRRSRWCSSTPSSSSPTT